MLVAVDAVDLGLLVQTEADSLLDGEPDDVGQDERVGQHGEGADRLLAQQFQATAQALLTQSALVLVQEYMYTEFDWRIGVLNRKAIFASKYFMSKDHWQIASRDASGQAKFGAAQAVTLDEVPADLLAHAVAAASLIGVGLYGVDMKMTDRGPVVIEVNDNPNIDAGNEDTVLGDEMYRTVLRDIVRRLDLAHGVASRHMALAPQASALLT